METATAYACTAAIPRTHPAPAALCDEAMEELRESLHAEYRAKYKEDVERYHERFGEEPSLGTLIAAEVRAECNHMTEGECRAAALRTISRIRAQAAASHELSAVRR